LPVRERAAGHECVGHECVGGEPEWTLVQDSQPQDEKSDGKAGEKDRQAEKKDENKKDEKKDEPAKPNAKDKKSEKKDADKKDKDALKRPKIAPTQGVTTLIHARKVIVRPGLESLDVDVLIRDGVIVGVGKGLAAPEGARTLEAEVVCAGFLDPWSSLGLEAESARTMQATADSRTTDALDPYSEPQLRRQAMRGGVTSARVQAAGPSPAGGLGAIVRLDFATAVETTPSAAVAPPSPAEVAASTVESHAAESKAESSEKKSEESKSDTEPKGDADAKSSSDPKGSDSKKDVDAKGDAKKDGAPVAPKVAYVGPTLAAPFGFAVLNESAALAASVGIPRQGNPDPFDRLNEVERLGSALDAGRRLNESRSAHAVELADWEKKIAEKEKELEKEFKKAKKDREKELKDSNEKDKEFKEKAYKEDKRPVPPSASPEDEAMALAARGEVPLVVEVHRAAEIHALLEMIREHPRVRLVLAGATEAAGLASEIAAASVAVIVYPAPLGTERPAGWSEHELGLAGILAEAGVSVLIGSGGSNTVTRDLSLLAGLAIGHGLSPEQAFDALTLRAAQTFDVADRIGSVEVGKQADLLLLQGEPLSPATRIQYVLIGGRVVLEPESR
jgi:imidazolonepropionase-like amidohydrolase